MTDTTAITIDERELAELRTAHGVLALTDEVPDPVLELERRAAALLAAELGVPLTLHDRSHETWGETPHQEGPFDIEAARAGDRPWLAGQMQEAIDLGAPDVRVVTTSVPLMREAIEDALVASGADVVMVPTGYRPGNLFTRLQVLATERGWVSARVPATTVSALPDGRLRVIERLVGTSRSERSEGAALMGHERWPPHRTAA